MTKKDKTEFNAYLKNCTDRQLEGVLEKERSAGRTEYVALTKQEMELRGLR